MDNANPLVLASAPASEAPKPRLKAIDRQQIRTSRHADRHQHHDR